MKYISNIIRAMMCVILSGCLSLDERLASSDYSTRKDAEYELYANAAKTGDEKSTIDAVNRLTCDEVLADIAISGKSQNVRAIAATKIRDNRSLYSVVTKSTDCKIKVVAINNMTDQAMILSVYNEQTEEPVKLAAIGRMNSDTIAKLPYSSSLATKWRDINDQRILKEIIENDLLKVPDVEWDDLFAKVTDESLRTEVEWLLAFTYSMHCESLSESAKKVLLDKIVNPDIIQKMLIRRLDDEGIRTLHPSVARMIIKRGGLGSTEEEIKQRRNALLAGYTKGKDRIAQLKNEKEQRVQEMKAPRSESKNGQIRRKIADIDKEIERYESIVSDYPIMMKLLLYVPYADARIPLYSKLSDESLASVCDKNLRSIEDFHADKIEEWNECATIVGNIKAQDIRTQKYIDLLGKIAKDEDRDKDRYSRDKYWNAETRVRARQYFDSWSLDRQPEIVEKMLTKGVAGCKYVARYAPNEMLLRLLREGKLNNNLQLFAAKKIDASAIDMTLYDSIKNNDARKILFARMSDSAKIDAQKYNESLVNGILEQATAKSQETFSLDGFYLGMSLDDMKLVFAHHFPDYDISEKCDNKDYMVYVSGQSDPFCYASTSDKKVHRFNFGKSLLKKWYKYDVQTFKEWAASYARETGADMRYVMIKDDVTNLYDQSSTVWFHQESYQYKSNAKGYRIIYFGEESAANSHMATGLEGMLIEDAARNAMRKVLGIPGTLRVQVEKD